MDDFGITLITFSLELLYVEHIYLPNAILVNLSSGAFALAVLLTLFRGSIASVDSFSRKENC